MTGEDVGFFARLCYDSNIRPNDPSNYFSVNCTHTYDWRSFFFLEKSTWTSTFIVYSLGTYQTSEYPAALILLISLSRARKFLFIPSYYKRIICYRIKGRRAQIQLPKNDRVERYILIKNFLRVKNTIIFRCYISNVFVTIHFSHKIS